MEEKSNPGERLNLEELKKEYQNFKDKYDLPEFHELNKCFEVEEVDIETDFFLRKIRKIISEKITGYLRFFEILLNPSAAPIFFFKLIKKLDNGDRERINKIYERLGYLEVELVKLDLDYHEENEAEFIKKTYNVFIEVKKEILDIIGKMSNGGDVKKEKGSYFG